MALNFSHRPLFSAHTSEENLVSPMRIANGFLVESTAERNGDMFSRPWCSNHDKGDCFDYGRGWGDRCGSQDSASVDILDLLPSDPFGMDISTTFTAITGWLEDLEVDYTQYRRAETGVDDGNYQLFAGLNFVWKNALKFQELSQSGISVFDNESESIGGASNVGFGDEACHGAFVSASSADEVLSLEKAAGQVVGINGPCKDKEGCSSGEDGAVHPAFSYSLCHLGIRDLLSVSMACKSLQSTVQDDPLLWKHIHISQPSNEKITDDILLQLTDRAQGTLHCLSLIECSKITDEGLKRVLESNPKLVKLSVPGCTRITIEGLLNMLRDLKTAGRLGVKHIRIGGLYGVTKEHFEEFVHLLGVDYRAKQNFQNPRFYHRGELHVTCDEDRAIDIEMCPKCQNFRLVYDCPAEGCKGNGHDSQSCRACTLCIQRCVQCGRCINDSEYEETFCLEYLCSDCLNQVFKCPDGHMGDVTPSEPSSHCESSGSDLHG
ncbi:PREDICTED: F-box protein SKIP14-like [Tarenaya hassleriana]|uniref:F-box protein SKIP14-like n=1 Tax=Tarenaya hassleriana TaxID=28532 RepID=UPI00053C745F|nr:PREDICTED: F-box protein SKIP14-like [Tarenaya hassleriana]